MIFQPQLLETLKNYNREQFLKDLMAGIIVGVVALPLGIAFGIASGVSPEKGIFTCIIAGFIISFFGGSKVQIGGPTGAFIVIVSGVVQEFGVAGLAVATIMAGLMLIGMGLLRMGSIIKFIPFPVVVGLNSGIAFSIFNTQIKDLFGLQIESMPANFIGKWEAYFNNFSTFSLLTLGLSLLSIAIIVFTPRFNKKITWSFNGDCCYDNSFICVA